MARRLAMCGDMHPARVHGAQPAREAAYPELFHLIQADGVIERWQGRKTSYLYPGDGYKYRAMTTIEP